MVKFWRAPHWVSYTPIATTCLLETANLGQIVRMWTYHTAAGQSLTSWCCVNVALWLWANQKQPDRNEGKGEPAKARTAVSSNPCPGDQIARHG
jgi:hypothetical protein